MPRFSGASELIEVNLEVEVVTAERGITDAKLLNGVVGVGEAPHES